MLLTKAYAAPKAKAKLVPWTFERREVKPHDIQFDILYCGVCHSDLHQVKDEWGNGKFPMVPGHEIVGRVTKVGNKVGKFEVGDLAAVGCLVDSCRECENCNQGLEQYCLKGASGTYNAFEQDRKTPTYGGYSNFMVVHEDFALRVSKKLPLPNVAPLLCAGITTYSPLRHWKVGKGQKVAIVGLGGLGHMGVKFAAAFGAEVTVLSTSANKKKDALKLGAHKFLVTKDEKQMKSAKGYFDFILDTVSAPHEMKQYLPLLRTNGTLVIVGIPTDPHKVPAFNLIGGRKSLAGSSIGGIPETQEMLDFCTKKNITADIELIAMKDINKAYERMLKGDVHYRFVIDMATL